MKAAYYIGNCILTIDICMPLKYSPGEIRLRVAYRGVCGTDLHIFHGKSYSYKMPRVREGTL